MEGEHGLELPRSELRDLFLRHGYEGTTLRMLAQAAGSSERELYELVGSKGGAALRALEYEMELWQELVARAARDTGASVQPVVRLLDSIRQEQGRPPKGLLVVDLAAQLHNVDEVRVEVAAAHRQMLVDLSQLLPATSTPVPQREVAIFALGSILGSVLLAKTDSDNWELETGFARLVSWLDGTGG